MSTASTEKPLPPAAPPAEPHALAPLRHSVFRSLWIAALVSNVGTWIQDVGQGWAMTELSTSAFMVSLIQAAMTLPLFILAIPAGALADVFDRRRILLIAQGLMAIVTGGLALLAWQGRLTAHLLLWQALCIGIGSALANPAWQTVMTSLVPSDQLKAAAGLNSLSMNLSRAVGPALGGVVVSAFGPHAAFALNALSFLGIIVVLARWKPQRVSGRRAAPAEQFLGAVKAGVRYVRYSRPMRAVLVRTFLFVIFSSVLWALLPVLARRQFQSGAAGYGVLLTALGAGAVSAALILPSARRHVSSNRLVCLATLGFAAALVGLAFTTLFAVGAACIFVCGMGWLTMVTTLNWSAQAGTPAWVRARALACYFAAFFGSMALGSALWGLLAERSGVPAALLLAAGGMSIALFTIPWFGIVEVSGADLASSDHWGMPAAPSSVDPADGPVVVTVEYVIRPNDVDAFRVSMKAVSETRYRDGAMLWTLSRCTEEPDRWIEVFMVESWAEHLRQHERVTLADKRLQVRASSFHVGPDKPRVRHYIAAPIS